MSNTQIKVCGLTTADAVIAAGKVEYNGFVFFPPSPRHVSVEQAIALKKYSQSKIVAVTVNPDDDFLSTLIKQFQPDYIQLHGDETVERTLFVKNTFKIPVIKAFKIKTVEDLKEIALFEPFCDMVLLDAKVADGLPGGNGITFDWNLLKQFKCSKPWFLSGGITIENIKQALGISGAERVDVSSSLENPPGIKSPALIKKFIDTVKSI